jgi:hypothetical protein
MTVRELLASLQQLPKDAELLAFEAGCENYCEREVDESSGGAAGSTYTSAFGATTRRTGSQWGALVPRKACSPTVIPQAVTRPNSA